MQTRIAIFFRPLDIDVKYLASFYPEFRYRGPFQSTYSGQVTSEYIMNDADQENRFGFLKFGNKTDAGFGSVISGFPPRELASLFTKLPHELSTVLIAALKGTPLEIPTLSPAEHEAMQKNATEESAKRAARLEKLHRVKAPLRGAINKVDFKPEQSACILQCQRLIKAQLVVHERVFHGQHGIYYLTRLGANSTDLPAIKNIPKDNYAHQLTVTEIFIKLQERFPENIWIGERRIKHEKFIHGVGKKYYHLPDGIFVFPDSSQIAIEVELTMKSKKRLDDILWGYMLHKDIEEVWYYCSPDIINRVAKNINTTTGRCCANN